MLRSIINYGCLAVCLISTSVQAQQGPGIRAGLDLSKLVRSELQEGYRGAELFGDLSFKKGSRIAIELGNERFRTKEEIGQSVLYQYSVSGSYLKVGLDWDIYAQKKGEKNQITAGVRYALSQFTTDIGQAFFYDTQAVQTNGNFPLYTDNGPTLNSLKAQYLEGVLSFKTHLVGNFYIGGSFRMAFLTGEQSPDNFDNLWVPGFNKVTDGARFGFSYNYGISYFIPLKKDK